MRRRLAVALTLCGGWACAAPPADGRPTHPSPPAPSATAPDVTGDAPAVNDPAFHRAVQLAITAHPRWGRVDDRARFAPWDCRMPPPPRAFASASDDADTHGSGKLFTVFALDPVAYGFPRGYFPAGVAPAGQDCPGCDAHRELEAMGVRQVLLKDAYEPLREAPAAGTYAARDGDRGLLPATRDGVTFHAGRSLGYFLLIQYDADTPGTDAGWAYGTATPEGTITSAGRVASCMGCHQQRPQRFFGIPYVPAFGETARVAPGGPPPTAD